MPKGIELMRRRVRVGNWSSSNFSRNNPGSRDASQRRESHTNESITSSMTNMQDDIFNEDELGEYRQLFNLFDFDDSGAIGHDEMKRAILSFGHQATDAEIDQLIQEVDSNGDGEIDFAEFCHCMRRSKTLKFATNEEFVRQCFKVLDQDNNGLITQGEFTYIAKEVGGFSDELAAKIFDELDVSSNGHLSADQFNAICADYMLNDQGQLYSG